MLLFSTIIHSVEITLLFRSRLRPLRAHVDLHPVREGVEERARRPFRLLRLLAVDGHLLVRQQALVQPRVEDPLCMRVKKWVRVSGGSGSAAPAASPQLTRSTNATHLAVLLEEADANKDQLVAAVPVVPLKVRDDVLLPPAMCCVGRGWDGEQR